MQLPTSRKRAAIVGLDLEAASVAAVELPANGGAGLGGTGIAPLPPGLTREGEVTDPAAMAEVLAELFRQENLPKQVRVGVANQRLVVRTLRLPMIENRNELDTAVRFQAQEHIPMPLDQAVLDWEIVAKGVGEGQAQMDVVVVAARREMVDSLLETVSGAGLVATGIDVSAFAMIRALSQGNGSGSSGQPYEQRIGSPAGGEPQAGTLEMARLYCSLGDVTNVAVARGSSCLFTRVSSFGIESVAQRLAERRGLTLEHARQWLVHVGLGAPLEEVDGDPEIAATAREVLIEGASKLADEVRLSLDFYATQEGALAVDGIVVCGPGTVIEGLPEHLEQDLGHGVEVGRPRALSHLDEATAARLTLSYGLALEE